MPKTMQIFRIFVASPSDVKEEADAVFAVVEELNRSVAQMHGIKFEVFSWENNVIPGFSTDPQEVINQQIPDDYDIFLGIFWTRIGTPTRKAASGSVEEFEAAYKRFLDDPESVRILIYFKEAPIPVYEIDLEQFKELKKFRDKISSTGLYKPFITTEEFTLFLRMNLTNLISIITPNPSQPPNNLPAVAKEPISDSKNLPVETTQEEEGFLDIIERGSKASDELFLYLSNLTKEMGEFTTNTELITTEINLINAQKQPNISDYKRVTNAQAENMDAIASKFESGMTNYDQLMTTVLEANEQTITLLLDFGINAENLARVEESLSALSELRKAMSTSNTSFDGLCTVIAKTPRLTTKFNHSRRILLQVLQNYQNITIKGINLIDEIENSGQKIIANMKREIGSNQAIA